MKTCLALLPIASLGALLLVPQLAARAEGGEIVFSARFYAPSAKASSRSYWHLYRIDPGGKNRTQITFGPYDDEAPHWSADGKAIYFRRLQDAGEGRGDGKTTAANFVFHVATARTELITAPPSEEETRPGRKAAEIVTSDGTAAGGPRKVLVMKDGNVPGKRIPLHFAAADKDSEGDIGSSAESVPGNAFLVSAIGGDSTSGHWNRYFRVDATTGATAFFTEGEELSWSPDGRRFVTHFGRDLTPYGKPMNGHQRSVWVSPLLIGDTATGKTKTLVGGAVFVIGADWQPGHTQSR